jgi:hypothetical protein
MRKRLTKVGAAIAALAALAVGGSALASAAGGGSQPAKAPAVVQKVTPKAEAPAKEPAEKAGGAADTDSIQDENGKDDASEPAGNETAERAESGSEVPGDDGPGGHADEPGNPNADTQQEGEN